MGKKIKSLLNTNNTKEIKYNTFPRSGTMTLKTTLEKVFLNYHVKFGFHLKSMIKGHIISLRNPYDSIESLVEFCYRYSQSNKIDNYPVFKKRKTLIFDFESGSLKYENMDFELKDISKFILGYSSFYCSFMKEIKNYKNEVFVISFENLISDPNKSLNDFSNKFNLDTPAFIDVDEIRSIVPKIHLPRKDVSIRKIIKNELQESKKIKDAYDLYEEVYADFCV